MKKGKQCAGKTKKGKPCGGWAVTGSKYCFSHSPSRRKERKAARRVGGQNSHTPQVDASGVPNRVRTLEDVLEVLDYTLASALVMENGVSRGRLLVSIVGAYVSCIQETEFEQRLAQLEDRVNV